MWQNSRPHGSLTDLAFNIHGLMGRLQKESVPDLDLPAIHGLMGRLQKPTLATAHIVAIHGLMGRLQNKRQTINLRPHGSLRGRMVIHGLQ